MKQIVNIYQINHFLLISKNCVEPLFHTCPIWTFGGILPIPSSFPTLIWAFRQVSTYSVSVNIFFAIFIKYLSPLTSDFSLSKVLPNPILFSFPPSYDVAQAAPNLLASVTKPHCTIKGVATLNISPRMRISTSYCS